MAYDIESNSWSRLKTTGNAPDAESMGTNVAYFEYDPALDLVVVIQMAGKTLGVHAYNPKTNSWADALPFPVGGPKFQYAGSTCYDRELNVYFCHVARDSEDDGVVWAYRYKKRD